jgi:hypothetical protein
MKLLQYSKARDAATLALEFEPNSYKVRYNRAHAQLEEKYFLEAREDAQWCLTNGGSEFVEYENECNRIIKICESHSQNS